MRQAQRVLDGCSGARSCRSPARSLRATRRDRQTQRASGRGWQRVSKRKRTADRLELVAEVVAAGLRRVEVRLDHLRRGAKTRERGRRGRGASTRASSPCRCRGARRGHGADGEAVRRKGRRTQCEKTRGRGAGETVRRRRKAHRRLHAGDTLVRHTLQQADVEVHLVPLDGLRAREEEGSAWCCGAQGRHDVDAVRQRTTPSIFLNGRAADVCHSCGLRRIRLLSVSRMRLFWP